MGNYCGQSPKSEDINSYVHLEANHNDMLAVYEVDEKPVTKDSKGKLLKAVDRKTGFKVAIKQIEKNALSDKLDIVAMHRELKVMQTFSHPHIVRYLEAYENK